MHDPFHILNSDSSDMPLRQIRSMSMISMDSVSSMVSTDEGFSFAQDEEERPSGSALPKNERPAQPTNEREYFERLWAENFERSEARVDNTTAFIPVGVAARLNRIKGFSFARDAVSHKLYTVYRLEIECIANEKQWTIYRRFHDFKQLAHQLKNVVRLVRLSLGVVRGC